MDISKEYIKMCDCEEIQGGKQKKQEDFFYNKEMGLLIDLNTKENIWEIWKDDTYLPMQDQIQKMMGCVYPGKTPCYIDDYLADHYDTWEKLWLCIYMRTKHSKIWDGNKWTKTKK